MSSNTNIGNTPVNQGYVQLIHMGETGGIDGTLRALYDGDGTASDLLIASDKVKISTTLYIGSDTLAEYIQDTVGAMFSSNTETNITVTYQDGDGTIDLVSSGEVTLTGSETLTNKTLTSPVINTGISGTAILDEDNMASNSATKLSTQQSIKAYVDAEVSGIVDSAPGTLNTLNELAAALGDDANYATTTATSLGEKLVKASNLSDLTNAGTARSNLGLGSVATLSSIAVSNLTASAIQLSSESFADNDTSLMTSAAVQDKITSYGYTTNTGDITGVTAGTNCSGGGTSGGVTINVDDAFLKNDADDTTTGKITSNGLILPASHSTDKILMYSGGNEKIGTEANTFLFTADNFKFKDTNGDANLFMNNSGNVGIGTTSPSYNLHVKSASGSHAEVRIETPNDSTVPALSFNNGNQIYSLGIMANESFSIRDATSSWATRLAITTGGNVGIGTTSPGYKLDVAGQGKVTNGWLVDNGTTAGFFTTDSDNVNFGSSTSGKGLRLFSANAEKMRIDSSGNVGIGTTSPGNKFTVNSTSANQASIQYDASTRLQISVAGSGVTTFLTDNSAACSFTNIVGIGTTDPASYNNDGDDFVIYGTGNTGMSIASGTSSNGSIMFADGTGGTAGYRGAIKYNHGSDYMHFNTAAAERMRLESDGDLHLTADVVAYSSTPSDIRLKENFTKIENGLDIVNKLEGHTFNWKKGGDRLSAGFKAQEVEKVLPHLVDEKKLPLKADDDKEYKILRYEEMIPYLVEAIKEQQEEIELLKANYDQLKYNRR